MQEISTQILTNHQKELLEKLLGLADEKEEALTLTELEGFLFGLAITPDMIMPSEWIPEIFGGEIPSFGNENQARPLLKNLLDAYNAYNKAFNKGALEFPFDLERFSADMLQDIQEWSFGLLNALEMRPEIWHITDEEDFEEADDETKDIIFSFCTLYGVVYPDEAMDLFKKDGEQIDETVESIATLLQILPVAVETLQMYGEQLWEERVAEMKNNADKPTVKKIKVVRNDPCPCGSGKKYKHCCGKNLRS